MGIRHSTCIKKWDWSITFWLHRNDAMTTAEGHPSKLQHGKAQRNLQYLGCKSGNQFVKPSMRFEHKPFPLPTTVACNSNQYNFSDNLRQIISTSNRRIPDTVNSVNIMRCISWNLPAFPLAISICYEIDFWFWKALRFWAPQLPLLGPVAVFGIPYIMSSTYIY